MAGLTGTSELPDSWVLLHLCWLGSQPTQNLKDQLQEEPGMANLRSLTVRRDHVPGVSVPSQGCQMRWVSECQDTWASPGDADFISGVPVPCGPA